MVLTDKFFSEKIKLLLPDLKEKVAVAVSGGADSLCLTLMLNKYCTENGVSLTALTVDHAIRKESKAEAKAVHGLLKKQGITHHILTNKEKIGNTKVEEEARRIRYDLLTNFCKEHGISVLFLAHQQEDQVETFLSRLARGSGLEGLSGMKEKTYRNGLMLVRPFLDVSKKDIEYFLVQKGFDWIKDPMNDDESFERVKWRKFLPQLEEKGVPLIAVSRSAKRLARAGQALFWYQQQFLKEGVTFYPEGYALIDKEKYFILPDEIKIKVMESLLKLIGGNDKPISLELLERVCLGEIKKMTLASCVVLPHKRGIFVSKEHSKMPPKTKVKKNKVIVWDKFVVQSDCSGTIEARAPLKRKKNIPYLIQQSFPFFQAEKELENTLQIEYKESSSYHLFIKMIKKS